MAAANLQTDKAGNFRIAYREKDGRQRKIGLATMAENQANIVLAHVKNLIQANRNGWSLAESTVVWLQYSCPEWLRDRLEDKGLVAPSPAKQKKKPEAMPFVAWIDRYISMRASDTKPGTQNTYKHTREQIADFFGEQKTLAEITPGDADEFRLFLRESKDRKAKKPKRLSENSIRLRLRTAKQFAKAAIRRGLAKVNPFADLVTSVRGNSERHHFITQADTEKILNACPNQEWRVIVALSRFGGLRCPSEHLGLTWGDINWEKNRMLVRSPKTARHEGKESRLVPLFPELRRELDSLWDEIPDGTPGETPIITQYRHASQNLRTTFEKIVKRAGLKPWDRLFQNLRSSRETELAERFPVHVVCEWLGNSVTVAAKHYLQRAGDEHFERAATEAGSTTANVVKSGKREPEGTNEGTSGAFSHSQRVPDDPAANEETPKKLAFSGVSEGCGDDAQYSREDSNL